MGDGRKTVTIKLHRQHDADLIHWWERLPRGNHRSRQGDETRQATLKHLLRQSIGLPQPQPRDPTMSAEQIEWVFASIEYLHKQVGGDVREVEKRVYDQLGMLADQVRQLYQRFEAAPNRTVEIQPLDLPQQVEQDVLIERERRLRRTSW